MADYFRKYKSLYSSTTNSFGTGEAVTITPSSVSGLPTDTEIVLTFDRQVAGKLERIKGTISGGNFVVASGGRGYDGTTEQAHTAPTVETVWNAADVNDLMTGLLVGHTQTGLHDFNGGEVTIDADADTTMTADTDDQIDWKLGGSDRFRMKTSDFDIVTATGNIQVAGADPKRGMYIPAQAFFPATTNGCAALAQGESSTNKINYKYLAFDGAAEEYAWVVVPTPDYWDLSTITVKFHWTAASGSGDVIWGAAGLARSDDDALDTALGSAVTVTDTLTATGDQMTTAATSAITVGGTPAKGDVLYLRVYRDADASGDTLNSVDANLIGVTVKFGIGQYDDQ